MKRVAWFMDRAATPAEVAHLRMIFGGDDVEIVRLGRLAPTDVVAEWRSRAHELDEAVCWMNAHELLQVLMELPGFTPLVPQAEAVVDPNDFDPYDCFTAEGGSWRFRVFRRLMGIRVEWADPYPTDEQSNRRSRRALRKE